MSDLYAMLLTPGSQAQGLNWAAAHALGQDWALAAYAFADRRCRISPVPQARDYLLRAAASRRLGDRDGAAVDVQFAHDLDPLDPLVHQQALHGLDDAEQADAAAALVASPRSSSAQLLQAIAQLDRSNTRVVADLVANAGELSGWVSWPQGSRLTCVIAEEGRQDTLVLSPEAQHPLATPTRWAASITVTRTMDRRTKFRFDAGPRLTGWAAVFEPVTPDPSRIPQPVDVANNAAALLVIVPVFEDVDATIACLDSLRMQRLAHGEIAVVVIDDASPNPRIVAELDRRTRRGDFALIRNSRNLGFAASVNAACATRRCGDILLLNADTVLPAGALDRLLGVLRADDTVGTVTPVSNNGELTSFPVPHSANALPNPAELKSWDAAAAAVGAPPIDLPNGIGFCLLVRRHCWDRLNGIAQIYGRGYYEDVDLCLRARDLGYRNLCATNVVIGHVGSRSFQASKRALVVRNLETIETRFPSFQADSAAYLRAEPLRSIFAQIERGIPPTPYDRVLVSALSDDHPTARARIRTIVETGQSVLFLRVAPSGAAVTLKSPQGGVPQSLRYAITDPDELRALCRYLGDARIRRVEWLDVHRCPLRLFEALFDLGCPVDLLVAGNHDLSLCHADEPRVGPKDLIPVTGPERQPWWASRLRPGDRVLVSDRLAGAAVERIFQAVTPVFAIDPEPRCGETLVTRGSDRDSVAMTALAVLAPVATEPVTRFIRELAAGLARSAPRTEILVVGTTLNDRSLMASSRVFVTGPIPDMELGRVLQNYGGRMLVSPYRDSLFHRLSAARDLCSGAIAYFDWSGDHHRPDPGDLALDPGLTDREAADRIVTWYSSRSKPLPRDRRPT